MINNFNELIPIIDNDFGNGKIKTSNARDLWKFLGVKRKFTDWIIYQIKRGKFEENIDYIVFHKFVKRGKGASVKKEYHITLIMAKKIGMMSETDKGNEVRDYYIAVEKMLYEIKEKINQEKETKFKFNREDEYRDASQRLLTVDRVNKANRIFSSIAKQNDINISPPMFFKHVWYIVYQLAFNGTKEEILDYLGVLYKNKRGRKPTVLDYTEIEGLDFIADILAILGSFLDINKGDLEKAFSMLNNLDLLKIKRNDFIEDVKKRLEYKNVNRSEIKLYVEFLRDVPMGRKKARKLLDNLMADMKSGQKLLF